MFSSYHTIKVTLQSFHRPVPLCSEQIAFDLLGLDVALYNERLHERIAFFNSQGNSDQNA